MVAISNYFASVGIKVDDKSIKAVDAFLSKIEKKLESGTGRRGFSVTPRINMEGFEKKLRQALRQINGKSADKALRVNVGISERTLRKSIATAVEKGTYRAPITAVLDKGSLTAIRNQIKSALQNISTTISVSTKTGRVVPSRGNTTNPTLPTPKVSHGDALTVAQLNTMRRQIASAEAGSRTSPKYWDNLAKLQTKTQQELMDTLSKINAVPKKNGWGFSWSPNAGGNASTRAPNSPHLAEWLSGKPDKSSLSAANRRWSDSLMKEGLLAGAPNNLRGMLGEGIFGGLGRAGSSTGVGRGLGALGTTLGGARGGAVGLIGGAALSGMTTAFTGIWSGLGKLITTPFSLIGGAANAVTGAFYRLALAAAPLVAAFVGINRKVQDTTTKEMALTTSSLRAGSTPQEEGDWLYKTAMKEGMRYGDMIMPYSSFMNAYAPKMGMGETREMFAAFSQYGTVHGANKESSKNAFYALSQIYHFMKSLLLW